MAKGKGEKEKKLQILFLSDDAKARNQERT